MGRTQIYLNDEEIELLDRESLRTGASRSELIRRAVRKAYGELSPEERLALVGQAAGIWKDRQYTGAEYVEAFRSDSRERRRRLGLE